MRTLNLKQGTAEWLAHRRAAWNASDAPAMLGESPHCTRSELLHRMATGLSPEVDAGTQRRFDAGHAVEALLRAHAEKIIGEPLHPFVGVADFDERYSASFDGCTFVGDEVAESKLLNARLRAAFADMETIAPEHRERSACKSLPIDYRIQMEQQVRIAGATRVLFLTGELRADGTLGDTFSCWYYPDDALWARIQGGWGQFDADLAAYVPPAAPAAVVVAAPVQALPAVSVKVTGSITVIDNFAKFEVALRDFLEHRLIREPKTDQDFADLDVQIKAMLGAEAALDAAEVQMLAQIDAVDTAAKAKAMLSKLVRDNRLMAQKLLTGEKERRRGEIVAGGIAALREYVAGRNALLGKPYMPAIPADFAGAVKGLKSVASMEDKVATELARAKIAASEVFDRIQANLGIIHELASDFPALIPDRDQLVLKAPDDCRAALTSRIAVHQAAEAKRLEEQRERIRAEEQAKLRREQEEREATERRNQLALEAAATHVAALPPTAAPTPAPTAPNVLQMQRPTTPPAMAAAMPATLNLGAINNRMGFTMTAEFIKRMGFEPAAVDKSARLFTEAQFQQLCDSLVAHIRTQAVMANQQQAA